MLGDCLHLARALLRHSCPPASSWAVSPARWLPGAAGGGRKGRDREGWEGRGRGGTVLWPDGGGSSQRCLVLQVASVPARGGSVAGMEQVQVPGPWQHLALLPAGAWGKGTGLAAASPTASAASNTPSGTCLLRCQHCPQASQPHRDPARSQPLQALAKLLCRGKRVPEYLHPSLQHRQPSLLPPISTGQLFYVSPPSLQKIIIGPSHRTEGLKVVNSISKGFVMLVFPWLLHKAISTVPLRQLLSGCLLEVIGFFRSLFKIRKPAS